MKLFFAAFAVFALCLPLLLIASPVSAQEAKIAPAVPSAEVLALRQQNEVLKGQLQTMKDSNSTFISIVQWSLEITAGVLLTITIALVGYNWYTNKVVYDRDKKEFINMINAGLTEAISNYSKDIDTAKAALKEATANYDTEAKIASDELKATVLQHEASVKLQVERTFEAMFDRYEKSIQATAAKASSELEAVVEKRVKFIVTDFMTNPLIVGKELSGLVALTRPVKENQEINEARKARGEEPVFSDHVKELNLPRIGHIPPI